MSLTTPSIVIEGFREWRGSWLASLCLKCVAGTLYGPQPILTRRFPGLLLKHPAKVIGVFKSGAVGDFVHFKVVLLEHKFGAVEPDVGDVIGVFH